MKSIDEIKEYLKCELPNKYYHHIHCTRSQNSKSIQLRFMDTIQSSNDVILTSDFQILGMRETHLKKFMEYCFPDTQKLDHSFLSQLMIFKLEFDESQKLEYTMEYFS